MAGTFFGVSIAYSGLAAQSRAMNVLGYNIAHANDPTYKRQRVVLSENVVLAQSQESSTVASSAFGAGVNSGDVERVRDALIENRMRDAYQASASWEYRSRSLNQLEATMGEPSDTGLQADLDQFWSSWRTVATSPDSLPIRSTLLEDTAALCQRIQYQYMQIKNMKDDLNLAAGDRVDRINVIGQELARLNKDINGANAGDIATNDLLNRRDALVQELSKLVNITQHGDDKGNFVISVGGRVFVQGTQFNSLTTDVGANGNTDIHWSSDDKDVVITGGELEAIIDLRDDTIPDYLGQLDNIASTIVAKVNEVHRSGKTLDGSDGGDFFRAGSTAANISLDDSIVGHPELVAASSTGAVDNGEVASKIADLSDAVTANGLTINQLYRALIGDIGAATSTAERQATAHKLSLDQFVSQQQSISGVSLDEEMTNMIKFQQAYNASARTLTVMDEMLSLLIERTGTIGR